MNTFRNLVLFCINLFIIIILSIRVLAFTYQVGPTRPYQNPSQVGGLVGDNDTVEIDAGLYLGQDACVVWLKDNLVIRGVGGIAHMEAAGASVWGKGIWVAAGNGLFIENVEFSGASVPDNNGAGIRLDGIGLTVKNCYFHDNENGILGGASGEILIERSEFAHNGYGDGYSHNIYINHAQRLTVRYCYLHHAHIGHELKSRAHENYILYNRISNESNGDASRELDLPNGGLAVVIGNIFQQGPLTENGNMLAYGAEGLSNNPPHEMYLINNTLIDERGFGGLFLDLPFSGMDLFKAWNNIFVSPTAVWMAGAPAILDSCANLLVPDKTQLFFLDTLGYDYHLTSGSTLATDHGTDPGFLGSMSLLPAFEYVHPSDYVPRSLFLNPDIGAYEYNQATGYQSISGTYANSFSLRQVSASVFYLEVHNSLSNNEVSVFDMAGRKVCQAEKRQGNIFRIDLSGLTGGIYFAVLFADGKTIAAKLPMTVRIYP